MKALLVIIMNLCLHVTYAQKPDTTKTFFDFNIKNHPGRECIQHNMHISSRVSLLKTIIAIILLILRSFQKKGLCNSGLQAKSTTFVNNIKTEYNGRKQYNSR